MISASFDIIRLNNIFITIAITVCPYIFANFVLSYVAMILFDAILFCGQSQAIFNSTRQENNKFLIEYFNDKRIDE